MKNLIFYDSTTKLPVQPNSDLTSTLVTGVTYYAELDSGSKQEFQSIHSLHWLWDSAIIATITIEQTNCREIKVTDSATALLPASGWAAAPPATVSIPGGSASQDFGHWADDGAGRLRAKVVVGGTGGKLRGQYHSKAG